MYCCKLRLVDDSAIHFPVQLCGPLNADYDGDCVTVSLVPEEVKDDTYRRMSPRNNFIYKKTLKNIFEFSHEALNGLSHASEFTPNDPDDLKNPKYYYTDYAQLLKDVEVDHKLSYGTPITFTGKIGDVEYKNKITTYGRLRISKIIDADLDDIRVGGELILKPYQRIDAKSASKLITYLYGSPDWVEKTNELQKFAHKVVSKTGVVTFDYSTLYANTDNETYKDIRKIADSTELTDKQKLALLTDRYNKYLKEVEGEFSSDLKDELDRAGRVKLASIIAINAPSLIVNGIDEKVKVTKGNLLNGFQEQEYILHAIENRSLQAIKQSGVNSIGASL